MLVIAPLVAVAGVLWGTSIFSRVQTAGGFNTPDSQSQHEATLAAKTFGRDAGDIVVLYSSRTRTHRITGVPVRGHQHAGRASYSKVNPYASYWLTMIALHVLDAVPPLVTAHARSTGGTRQVSQKSWEDGITQRAATCPDNEGAGSVAAGAARRGGGPRLVPL